MNKVLVILGFSIMLITWISLIIGSEEIVTGEKICVDGMGDKNLEGIMCEDTEWIWFGLGFALTGILSMGLMLFGGIIMIIGVSYGN